MPARIQRVRPLRWKQPCGTLLCPAARTPLRSAAHIGRDPCQNPVVALSTRLHARLAPPPPPKQARSAPFAQFVTLKGGHIGDARSWKAQRVMCKKMEQHKRALCAQFKSCRAAATSAPAAYDCCTRARAGFRAGMRTPARRGASTWRNTKCTLRSARARIRPHIARTAALRVR